MATLKTKFSVGLFLIIGMTAAIVAIVWLGMSNYLEKGRFFVAYFDESVQGLDKDSPVKYRGVHIGRVSQINVAPDERLIEVLLKIESEIEPQKEAENIVAQLKSVGITGLMFIELERRKPGEADVSPAINFKPPYPVISTRPSDISKLFEGIEDAFNVFRAIDSKAISEQLVSVLEKMNASIDALKIDNIGNDLHATIQAMQNLMNPEKVNRLVESLERASDSINRAAVNADSGISEIRRAVSTLDRVVNASGDDVKHMTADLKQAAKEVKTALVAASALLDNTDQRVDVLNRQLLKTLLRMDQASETLTRFLERLSNQPSQVVFSGPAPDKPQAP